MSKKTKVILGVVLAVVLVGAVIFGVLVWKNTGDGGSPVSFTVNAEGWSEETSSPIPIQVTGETEDKEKVDEKYFLGASEKDLVLKPGTYEVEVYASPVNADGGMYRCPKAVRLSVPKATSKSQSKSSVSAEFELSPVSPREVSEEEIGASYNAMRDAGLSDEEIGQFEEAVEDAKLPAAAKLSDEELLNLLASAPLAPPEREAINGVTHYSHNRAGTDDYNVHTNDGSAALSVGGNSVADCRKAAKPLVVDVNNDGIRDIVSLVYRNPNGFGSETYVNTLNRIVVYTPTEDGKDLQILAYTRSGENMWDNFSELNRIVGIPATDSHGWFLRADNMPDGKIDWRTIRLATEPILGFDNGRISAKMIHTLPVNDSGDSYAESAENYTVFFEIQGDALVPVEARKG